MYSSSGMPGCLSLISGSAATCFRCPHHLPLTLPCYVLLVTQDIPGPVHPQLDLPLPDGDTLSPVDRWVSGCHPFCVLTRLALVSSAGPPLWGAFGAFLACPLSWALALYRTAAALPV